MSIVTNQISLSEQTPHLCKMKEKKTRKKYKNSDSVLLVDDNPKNILLLSDLLAQNGYQVSTATSGKMALRYLEENTPLVILLDIKMPEMNGFELCRLIKSDEKVKNIPVIFISALNEIDDKITAFQTGGVDYITKPFQVEEVLARVNTHTTSQKRQKQLVQQVSERKKSQKRLQKAYNEIEEIVKKRTSELEELKSRLEEENNYLQEEIKTALNFGDFIGNSKQLNITLGLVNQVAPSETTVLILGETGTGKELIARSLHNLSPRKDRPLVKVNCAALPSSLIESELFGHEKGAFTGAINQKLGRFELADQGTIFLDEIGDLPLELQAKLLRVLQEGEFERLGSTKTLKVDTRVIAATNRSLNELRSSGSFRDDLYFRLNVFPIECPALRKRKGDIPMLVSHFVNKYNIKINKKIEEISKKVMNDLQSYDWPGNVRELENIIERAIIMSQGKKLQLGNWLTQNSISAEQDSILSLDDLQKEHILRVLERTNWRIRGDRGAARILQLHPNTLDARMRKLGIKRN